MLPPPGEVSPRSRTGAILIAAASICIFTGAISLIDAADGWQDVLNAAERTNALSGTPCTALWNVGGWGDGVVLLLAAAALALVAFSAWASTGRPRRVIWARVAALAALVPIGFMWWDAIIVGRSQTDACSGAGLNGAASAAIKRAGWLFLGAVLFSVLACAGLRPRRNELKTSH